jgi:hypothetical protein
MSASFTGTTARICRRSAAKRKSTGVWKTDASVCPGSMLRAMMTPSIGARITA